jgi:hypothetical protein
VEAEQLSELRDWANRLEERAASEETRAEARAIRMLVDEVESLQQQLAAVSATAAARTETSAAVSAPAPSAASPTTESEEAPGAGAGAGAEDEPPWAAADERLSGSFFSRVKRTFGFE